MEIELQFQQTGKGASFELASPDAGHDWIAPAQVKRSLSPAICDTDWMPVMTCISVAHEICGSSNVARHAGESLTKTVEWRDERYPLR
jgi:hypothetical protein